MNGSALERVLALKARGLRPLPDAWPFPSGLAPALDQAGRVILEAVDSLLEELAAAPHGALATFPELAEAARLDLSQGRRLGFTRLDVVCPADDPTNFSLLEVQAGDPSAMGWHDALLEAHGHDTSHGLMASHRHTFERQCTGRRIAFVIVDGSLVHSDQELLTEHYRAHGWQAHCVDPRALTFEGGALRAHGQVVDAVFRDALDELRLEPWRVGGDALLQAHREGAVLVMNSFAAGLADDKSLLEALSTPARWPAKTLKFLNKHVPMTRIVRAGPMRWGDLEVNDFEAFAAARQGELVLKPVDGYGGFDVTVGVSVSASDWAAAVRRARAAPGQYVAQAYVPLPRRELAIFDGEHGTVSTQLANVVHSLWFHPHRGFAGAFVRASTGLVVNVHQGGGLAPVLIDELVGVPSSSPQHPQEHTHG